MAPWVFRNYMSSPLSFTLNTRNAGNLALSFFTTICF